PYVRYMQCERFTASGSAPHLDSIRVMMQPTSLGTHSGNHIVFVVMNAATLNLTDGTPFPFPNPNAQLKSLNVPTTRIHAGTPVDTIIKFTATKGGVPIDMSDTLGDYAGSFYIGMSVYYPDNKISLVSDSSTDTRNTLDPEHDRAAWVAYSLDNAWFTR